MAAPPQALAKWHTREMRGHRDKVFALGFSCDGRRLASGSNDMTLKIWSPDRSDYKNSVTLRGHTSKIVSLCWDPCHAERLASIAGDKTCKIWDIRQAKATESIPIPEGPLNISWSPDGKWIIIGNKANLLTLISTDTMTVHTSFKEPDEANEMVFSRDSQYLAIASAIGIKLLKVPEMQLIHAIEANPAACATLDLDPRGRYLVLGSNDSIASLWDVHQWFCVRTFHDQDSAVRTVRFSYDGDYLGLAAEDKWIDVISVGTGKLQHRIATQANPSTIAWSPTKLALAYAVDELNATTGRLPLEGVVRVMSAS